jgi:hypothetical protein
MTFSGWKTYLAAAGLFGLAIYQFSQKDYATMMTTFCAALAAAGLRHAISTTGNGQSGEPTLLPFPRK